MEALKSEKIKEGKYFQEGVRQFREGKVEKPRGPVAIWVKKFVSIKEYKNYYQWHGSYCFLKKIPKKGVWVGFCSDSFDPNFIPKDCELLDDEELRQVDAYRRANNIYPRPLEDLPPLRNDLKEFKSQMVSEEKKQFEEIFGEE